MPWLIDHIVLQVADVDRAVAFWRDLFGFAPTNLEKFRAGEAFFVTVRVSETAILDLMPVGEAAPGPDSGEEGQRMNHFCLAIDGGGFAALRERMDALGVPVAIGPMRAAGAQGIATSIWLRDPDGTLIEARTYDPVG
ncbi:MAG: VOC family protein [Myxococcales bacterium]|nr:VOC family protein [Myxococcales bacterium]